MAARTLLLGAACALFAGSASAFLDVRSEYGANIVMSNVRGVGSGATAAGRVVTGTANLVGPGGGSVAARMAVTVTPRMIVGGVSRFFPAVMVAGALYEVWSAMRMRQKTDGGTEWDSGEPMIDVPGTAYCVWAGGQEFCSSSMTVAARRFADWQAVDAVAQGWLSWSHGAVSCNGAGSCTWPTLRCQKGPGNDPPICYDGQSGTSVTTKQGGARRCANENDLPGFDGRCPTGQYGGVSPDDVADKWEANRDNPWVPKLTDPQLDGMVPGILERASDSNPWPTEGAPNKVVPPYPATVPGGVTTTTEPDGRVTETATGWNIRPAFEFPTSPGKSKWEKTTTTTTKDAQGNTISTSNTTVTPSVEAPGEEKDNCPPGSDRAGCADLGQVEDAELQSREVNVSAAPMEGWGASSDTCPAPPTFTILGQSASFDNTLVCHALLWMRGLILAAAGLAAAMIVIGGVKT